MFDVGEVVICIKSGADVPNPWHRANPLTVGAEYTVLEVVPSIHANGTRLEDNVRVDRSGRLWNASMFRRRERKTDIGFAHAILHKMTKKTKRRERA